MALDAKTIADSYVPTNMPVHDAVHMDVPYLDAFVDGQGVPFIHYRVMPCPIGKDDPYDSRKGHDHVGCSNGFIYEKVGELTCTFTGISKDIKNLDVGFVTGSSAQLTLPLFYTDDPRRKVSMTYMDRLYLNVEIGTVVNTQLYEHNISGKDRLKYPAVEVEALIDSHGNHYNQGEHFDLKDGQVVWRGAAQPGMNPETRKGEVCSIRYKYIPFWYVDRLIHEIRIVRNGPDVVRAPMSVLVQREYFFENEQNDRAAKDSARKAVAPRDGAFGPR